MPAGVVHHQYWERWRLPVFVVSTIFTTLAMAIAATSGNREAVGYIGEFWIWFNIWYFMGRWIDPDLDQPGVTAADGRMTRELGLFGVFFSSYWTLYANLMNYIGKKIGVKGGLFGSHRSWLTHSVFPGTVIRMVFVNGPLQYAYQFITIPLATIGGTLQFAQSDIITFLLAQFCGLGLADLIHIMLDQHYGEEYGTTGAKRNNSTDRAALSGGTAKAGRGEENVYSRGTPRTRKKSSRVLDDSRQVRH